jgi:hypothetical protein
VSHQYDPYWFDASDYLSGYVDPAQMQRWKGLVIDDELRELAALVRERLALMGDHKVAPMYTLAILCLESCMFYEDSEQIRARLKAEMRDAVGILDGILTREGTQREREERRAEAIAKDRRQIMGAVRDWPGNAVSFKLPMRWFDDWSRITRDGRWEVWPAPKPEPRLRWDSGRTANPIEDLRELWPMPPAQQDWFVSRAQFENLKRCEEWLTPNRTPAEQEAYVRSFQAQWPEHAKQDDRLRFIRREWEAWRVRFRSPAEQQRFVDELAKFAHDHRLNQRYDRTPFVDEYAAFTRADYDKLARRREVMGTFPERTPAEIEMLRAWANYYLATEQYDRTWPHVMRHGEAIPADHRSSNTHAIEMRQEIVDPVSRAVGPALSQRCKQEINDLLRRSHDVIPTLERFLAELQPKPEPDLARR